MMSDSWRPLLFVLLTVDVILKGLSLYQSARKEQKVWFVALILINSLGVLPLIYLLIQNSTKEKNGTTAPKKVLKPAMHLKKKIRK